jgi:hypothetical protein
MAYPYRKSPDAAAPDTEFAGHRRKSETGSLAGRDTAGILSFKTWEVKGDDC